MTRPSEETTLVLRVDRPLPNAIGTILIFAALVWVFACFAVYHARTGSWTIGVGGTLSDAGGIVMVGPLFAVLAGLGIGDRGPLRVFFRERRVLRLDGAALSWEEQGSRHQIAWEEIAGATTGGRGMSAANHVIDIAGDDLAVFEGLHLIDAATGSRRTLPEAIVAVRPDRYELVPGKWSGPFLARCVLRIAGDVP